MKWIATNDGEHIPHILLGFDNYQIRQCLYAIEPLHHPRWWSCSIWMTYNIEENMSKQQIRKFLKWFNPGIEEIFDMHCDEDDETDFMIIFEQLFKIQIPMTKIKYKDLNLDILKVTNRQKIPDCRMARFLALQLTQNSQIPKI